MKSLLIAGSLALAFATGSAMAADMAVKAPMMPAMPPPPTWTGCYIDAGIGYGMFDQKHNVFDTTTGALVIGDTNTAGEGWLGRVGGGCDYQIGSSWVIGLLGDFDWTHIHGTFDMLTVGGDENESSEWAIGGRIGYLITPNVLTYWSGGWTEARFDQTNLADLTVGAPFALFGQTTYSGWFLGGGYEYALSSILPLPGLFWRTEYRFSSYQGKDVQAFLISGAPAGFGSHMQKDIQTVTTSLVWRFNWFGH
jgi:outer membrane immunogenic protein